MKKGFTHHTAAINWLEIVLRLTPSHPHPTPHSNLPEPDFALATVMFIFVGLRKVKLRRWETCPSETFQKKRGKKKQTKVKFFNKRYNKKNKNTCFIAHVNQGTENQNYQNEKRLLLPCNYSRASHRDPRGNPLCKHVFSVTQNHFSWCLPGVLLYTQRIKSIKAQLQINTLHHQRYTQKKRLTFKSSVAALQHGAPGLLQNTHLVSGGWKGKGE